MKKTSALSLPRALAAAALLLFALAAGCEHKNRGGSNDSNDSSSSNTTQPATQDSSLVGSWRLVGTDGGAWFAHFDNAGNWKITDDAAGSARRVYGTYSVSGKTYSGPMVNPGVGEGRIEGSFDGDTMTMDFIEYWHDPAKHVPYTGTRL